jgi:hypothetical protein
VEWKLGILRRRETGRLYEGIFSKISLKAGIQISDSERFGTEHGIQSQFSHNFLD